MDINDFAAALGEALRPRQIHELTDVELVDIAGDRRHPQHAAASDELDARAADWWSRHTPAGGEC